MGLTVLSVILIVRDLDLAVIIAEPWQKNSQELLS